MSPYTPLDELLVATLIYSECSRVHRIAFWVDKEGYLGSDLALEVILGLSCFTAVFTAQFVRPLYLGATQKQVVSFQCSGACLYFKASKITKSTVWKILTSPKPRFLFFVFGLNVQTSNNSPKGYFLPSSFAFYW